jgi:phosphoribosylaminoimidazolecarboxamide formyltransferase/IMP cyclohydrolase
MQKQLKFYNKRKTIILIQNSRLTTKQVRSCLNGLLIQERNNITDNKEDLKTVTVTSPTEQEIQDLIFASKVCKTQNLTRSFLQKTEHSSGTGQTSRVDALLQAIEKQNLWF